MQLGDLKRQFLEYLEIERGRSVKTVENYDRYLGRFLILQKSKNRPTSPKHTYVSFDSISIDKRVQRWGAGSNR